MWNLEAPFADHIHTALRFWVEGNETDNLCTWVNNVARMALQTTMPLVPSCMHFCKSQTSSTLALSPTFHPVQSFSDSDNI